MIKHTKVQIHFIVVNLLIFSSMPNINGITKIICADVSAYISFPTIIISMIFNAIGIIKIIKIVQEILRNFFFMSFSLIDIKDTIDDIIKHKNSIIYNFIFKEECKEITVCLNYCVF